MFFWGEAGLKEGRPWKGERGGGNLIMFINVSDKSSVYTSESIVSHNKFRFWDSTYKVRNQGTPAWLSCTPRSGLKHCSHAQDKSFAVGQVKIAHTCLSGKCHNKFRFQDSTYKVRNQDTPAWLSCRPRSGLKYCSHAQDKSFAAGQVKLAQTCLSGNLSFSHMVLSFWQVNF